MRGITQAVSALDPHQALLSESIRTGTHNIRAIAGAGAGKTRTVVTSIAASCVLDGIEPSRVCVTTFTNKAGKEIHERLTALMGAEAESIGHCKTFHSLAARALREADAKRWSMRRCMDIPKRAPGIPDSDWLWRTCVVWTPKGIPGLLGLRGLDLDLPFGTSSRDYGMAAGLITAQGHEHGSPEAMKAARAVDLPSFVEAWALYEKAKRALQAWDWSDCLLAFRDLLADGRGPRFDLVIVDEAQDNSAVQAEIASLLAETGRLIVVGDARQSIYRWRGASPELFLSMGEGANADHWDTLYLPTNYRSGSLIVETGNRIADGADWSRGPRVTAHRDVTGAIDTLHCATPMEEGQAVAEAIVEAIEAGDAPEDHAILVRTNAAAAAFESALLMARIPVTRLGASGFFGRAAAKDTVAWLTLAESDDTAALKRVYNRPKRYLGRAFMASLDRALAQGMGMVDAIRDVAPTLRGGSRQGARDLADLIEGLRALPYSDRVSRVHALLAGHTRDETGDEASSGEDSARELYATAATIAGLFDSAAALSAFADECEANTMRGTDTVRGRVTVSTVHRSKGLEWKSVFVSASAGVFPHVRSTTPERIEEERRLFYVAVTRAADSLVITSADENLRGKPAGISVFTQDYVLPAIHAA